MLLSLGIATTALADDIAKQCPGNPKLTNFTSPLSPLAETPGTGPFYSADPSARVWNINGKDVLYLYCSHDMDPTTGCGQMDRYHVFSTEDLVTWTDHGEIICSDSVNKQYKDEFPYAYNEDPKKSLHMMWAPDAMYNPNDKTYYFYFPHCVSWKGENGATETVWKIFVATSKDPATGFKVVGYLKDAVSRIDPNVFLDDDGTLYFYQGGGSHVFSGKFKKDDWTQLDGTPVEMTGATNFHEGAWVFKKDGIYYLTYPDNHDTKQGGNQLRYATSTSPLGPWTEKGIYMHPHGGDTAHGSVVYFKGKWYQFYHTGNYSGLGNRRSVCVDELTFDDNGGINMVKNWGDPKGGTAPQLGNDTVTIEAENYNDGGSHYGYYVRTRDNHVLETKTEGETTYISALQNFEWTRYTVNSKGGAYPITVRCRQQKSTDHAQLILAVDGCWQTTGMGLGNSTAWQEITFDAVSIPEGLHYLELRNASGTTSDPNKGLEIDWIKVGEKKTTIEAEDFDQGGEGVGYHWRVQSNANGTYRSDAKFATEDHIGWLSGGDWMNYTFNIDKDGYYHIDTYAAAGSTGCGFKLAIDGEEVGQYNVPSSGWNNYAPVTAKNVKLTAGQHKLTLTLVGSLNIDKFVLTRQDSLEVDNVQETVIATIDKPNNAGVGYTSGWQNRGGIGPFDLSQYKPEELYISFDMDITEGTKGDVDMIGLSDGAFEITSSGKSDSQELNWGVNNIPWQAGKHTYLLQFSNARKGSSDADFNYKNVNFFRLYMVHFNTKAGTKVNGNADGTDWADGHSLNLNMSNLKIIARTSTSTGIVTTREYKLTKDNVYYDLSGRRVVRPTKGIYIKNGRKIIF